MVHRIFVEKKAGHDGEAAFLTSLLQRKLCIYTLKNLRMILCVDVENLTKDVFERAISEVFSTPALDEVYETLPRTDGTVFSVTYRSGYYDRRAEIDASCIALMNRGVLPTVRYTTYFVVSGDVSSEELDEIKRYLIDSDKHVETFDGEPVPLAPCDEVPGECAAPVRFSALDAMELDAFAKSHGMFARSDEMKLWQELFRREKRDPTLTELLTLDVCRSKFCYRPTSLYEIDTVKFQDDLSEDAFRSYLKIRAELGLSGNGTIRDIATAATEYAQSRHAADEIVTFGDGGPAAFRVRVPTPNGEIPWLVSVKSENPDFSDKSDFLSATETCLGSTVCDLLARRSYAYAGLRITAASGTSARTGVSRTISDEVREKKLTMALSRCSSYAYRIGIATGMVDGVCHRGYKDACLEIGAVLAAAPESNFNPAPLGTSDAVFIVGGKTGRDGAHLYARAKAAFPGKEIPGACVPTANPETVRKLQRFFRNPASAERIKWAAPLWKGGIAAAVGNLALGVRVDLSAVPLKYPGLTPAEIALSESSERMIIVLSESDASAVRALAEQDGLTVALIGRITSNRRLTLSWKEKTVLDLPTVALTAEIQKKTVNIAVPRAVKYDRGAVRSFKRGYLKLLSDPNVTSREMLSRKFDATVGAATVLLPSGGKYRRTPIQTMVHKLPVDVADTDICTFLSWGGNPSISEKSPFHGSYLSIVDSVSNLVAAGADASHVYLTFRNYFEELGEDPKKWGAPLSSALGAFRAQRDLGLLSIGGKDAASAIYEGVGIPPTTITFAVSTGRVRDVITPEIKQAGHKIIRRSPAVTKDGLPDPHSLKEVFSDVTALMRQGKVYAATAVGFGGIAEAVHKMCIGNRLGFTYADTLSVCELFDYAFATFLLEVDAETPGDTVGFVTEAPEIRFGKDVLTLDELDAAYEERRISPEPDGAALPQGNSVRVAMTAAPRVKVAKPRAVIPISIGSTAEYDIMRAVRDAGGEPICVAPGLLTPDETARFAESFAAEIAKSQMILLPGGFSDGSDRFLTTLLRHPLVKEQVEKLLCDRDGLMAGFSDACRPLFDLGLVPFGKIFDRPQENFMSVNFLPVRPPQLVSVRVLSNASPWLSAAQVGEVYTLPLSPREGRIVTPSSLLPDLLASGQIAAEYRSERCAAVPEFAETPLPDTVFPAAVTSPDGRVCAGVAHTERSGKYLYKNISGLTDLKLFESAVKYFKK